MARRRKKKYKNDNAEEFFSEIVEIGSLLPWWLAFGLAFLLIMLVPLSNSGTEGSIDANQAISTLFKIIFGIFFKYFVSIALFLGGIVNLLKRGKSAWMFKSISKKGAKEMLRQLNWKDFEFLISEYFKKEGYQVYLIDAQGADGGVDIRIKKGGELHLVQCKHYKAWKVSVKVVRELYGVMAAEGAVGGFVVTTGRFTKDAHSFASGKQLELIDGSKLEKMLDGDFIDTHSKGIDQNSEHICTKCGDVLVKRHGKRGEFWGCKSFPKCRFTKDMD